MSGKVSIHFLQNCGEFLKIESLFIDHVIRLLPYFLPFHPGRFWCQCRIVFLPMSYGILFFIRNVFDSSTVYGQRMTAPMTPLLQSLREVRRS